MTERREDRAAVERFDAAREHRDRRAHAYESARGSSAELAAFTELKAAEQQLAAREAWRQWTNDQGSER